jgi:hypothetical protein
MANIELPNIGAIIPTVRGRKIAYAVFALVSLVVGNALIFASTVYGQVPLWLVGIAAVVTNTAPIFSGIAMANVGPTPEAPTEPVVLGFTD